MREIRVLDAADGEGLDEACVTCELHRWQNWFHQPPLFGEPCDWQESDEPAAVVPVHRIARGVFSPEEKTMCATTRWFFPIPYPLGWNLYDEHAVAVTVSAAGYDHVVFRYSPETLPEADYSAESSGSRCELNATGVLRVWLAPPPRK